MRRPLRSLSPIATPLAGRPPGRRALLLSAALAPALLLALGVAAPAARTSIAKPTSPPAPAPRRRPRSPAPAPPGRYRIVGCRSHGGLYFHGPARREVAIGFDDGPAPDTAAFVGMLERNHAHATFFVIGEQVRGAYRATLLRELRDGDVIADHTFSHPDLTRSADIYGQLGGTIAAIRAQTGYTPCLFRPPYGVYDRAVVHVAHSLGLATVLWDVDPTDWALPGTEAIEQRVLAQVRPGSIILSHDGGGPRGETLAAYPAIIAALRRRGYRIVTIPQLLGFRPVYVPCIRLCYGIGLPRRALPRDAILLRAR